jgi:hypothetical protein
MGGLASSVEPLEQTSALKCSLCGSEDSTLLVCNYCGEFLCADHRLLDDHQCGVRRVRRAAGSKEFGRSELLRNLKRLDTERWEKEGGMNAAFDNGLSKTFTWLEAGDDPNGRVSTERIDRLNRRLEAISHTGVAEKYSGEPQDADAIDVVKKALTENQSKRAYFDAWRLFNKAWLAAKGKQLAEGDKMKFSLLTERAASLVAIDRIEEMEEYAVGLRTAMADLDKFPDLTKNDRPARGKTSMG